MSRLSFVPTDKWPQELRDFVQADAASEIELGITRMLAHAPKAAMGPLQFGAALGVNRTLPERLIELLRLRIAFHNQCRSCMAIRYAAAEGSFDEATACALEQPEIPSTLSKPERLAIELGDRFATQHLTIDGDFFEQLKAQFTEEEIVELLMHCALYVGMGRLAAVLDMTENLPNGFSKPFGESVKLSDDKPFIVS